MAEIMLENLIPTEFSLDELTLISTNGTTISLKFIADELNIYEDIFSNVVTGDLEVVESINLVNQYAIHGNEYLRIRFSTPQLTPYDKYFRIYKISEKTLNTQGSVRYKIFFCSEEFILNQQTRVSKSYKGLYINEIIDDILSNTLSVDVTKKFPIFSTTQKKDVIVPNMRPLEAINWLASMSVSENLDTAFLFYENRFGFNFKSLSELYKQDSVKTLKIKQKNKKDMNNVENIANIDRFEIKQQFNVLDGINAGAFSSSGIKLNLMHRKFDFVNYDAETSSVALLNEFASFNTATNRFNSSLLGGSSFIRLTPGTDDELIDVFILKRASEFAILNQQKVFIVLPGDSMTTVGDVVTLDFPDYSDNGSATVQQDMFISGKYLVTSLRHRIAKNKYYSFMEISKNSNAYDIVAPVDSTPYEEARKL